MKQLGYDCKKNIFIRADNDNMVEWRNRAQVEEGGGSIIYLRKCEGRT